MSNKYIHKYLLGEATQSETRALYEWLEQKEANRVDFLAIRIKWEKTNSRELNRSSIRGFNSIKEKYYRQKKSQRKIVVGALVLAVCVVAWFVMLENKPKSTPVSLEFQKTPLTLVISRIEATYNIQIEVQDQRDLNCEFTGVFYNASPANLVASVAKSKGLSASRINDTKFILNGRCLQ